MEIQTIDQVFGVDPKSLTKKRLQEIYIATIRESGELNNDYTEWPKNTLLYNVAINFFKQRYNSYLNKETKDKCLLEVLKYIEIINEPNKDDKFTHCNLVCTLKYSTMMEFARNYETEGFLDNAFNIFKQISEDEDVNKHQMLIEPVDHFLNEYKKDNSNKDKIFC